MSEQADRRAEAKAGQGMSDRLADIKELMTEQWSVGNDLCHATWNDMRWLLDAVEQTTNMYRSQLALTRLALVDVERLEKVVQDVIEVNHSCCGCPGVFEAVGLSMEGEEVTRGAEAKEKQ